MKTIIKNIDFYFYLNTNNSNNWLRKHFYVKDVDFYVGENFAILSVYYLF